MAENEVTIQVTVDAKDAQATLEQFGKESAKVVKQTESGFSKLEGSFKSAVAGIAAATAAFAGLRKAIGEGIDAERETRALSLALASTGEFSQQALESISAFSQELSNLTGIADGQIKTQLAVAKSFGISNDQAQELVKAASNLAAVTGVDLDTAVQQLGGTLTGSAGRIGKLGAEFRDLTKEQLQNGKAIELLNKRYAGAGAALGDTFEGGLNKLKNAFDDAFEAIGTTIIQDKGILQGLKTIADALKSFAPILGQVGRAFVKVFEGAIFAISAASATLSTLISGLASFAGLDSVAQTFDDIATASGATAAGILEAQSAIEQATSSGQGFDATLKNLNDNAKEAAGSIGKAASKAAEDFKKAQTDAQKFVNDLIKSSGSEVEVAAKKAGDSFAQIASFEKRGLINFEQAVKAREAILSEFGEKSEKATKDRLEKEAEAYKGSFDAIKSDLKRLQDDFNKQNLSPSDQIDAALAGQQKLIAAARKELEITGKKSEETEKILADFQKIAELQAETARGNLPSQFDAFVTALTEGFQKASAVVGPVIQQAIALGTGQTFKDFFTFAQSFASIPENISSIFDDFSNTLTRIADGLPAAITKVVESLPKIAEELALKLGDVFTKIARALPQIFRSLLKAFGSFVKVLFEEIIPEFIKALPAIFKEIFAALPGIIETIVKALPEIITEIFKAIPQIVRSLIDAIPAIIEVLAENIDEIVLAFVDGIISASGEIVAGLIDSLLVDGGLERIVGALIRAIPRIAVALVQGVARGLVNAAVAIGTAIGGAFSAAASRGLSQAFSNLGAQIKSAFASIGPNILAALQSAGSAIGNAIASVFRSFQDLFNIQGAFQRAFEPLKNIFDKLTTALEPLTDALTSLRDRINEAGGVFGKGGGRGVIAETAGRVGKALGFAGGGVVPLYAADGAFVPRGTDTVPAMLTPGELVVPTDMVGRLGAFLEAQTGTGGEGQQAILTAILQAVSQPMAVKAEAKVNQQAFADIMLQLSRQNARISA